jgi:ADP-ribosyl-[dinitrogen reductase] hydrolase
MAGGGWLRLKPGQITDDTQMSLHLGRALIAHGGWDARAAAEEWAAWWRSRPIDIGNTCRRGILRFIKQGSLSGPAADGDGGNGAAMRILPLALATLHDDAHFAAAAIEQAHVTHHHPLSDAATVTLGRMVQQLLNGRGMATSRALADDLAARHPQFRFEPYPGRASGYIVDTVQTVLHGFFTTTRFADWLIAVVNRGEDADTTGAIAGMLAGALYGVAAIPPAWLKKLEHSVANEIETQVDALLSLAHRAVPETSL